MLCVSGFELYSRCVPPIFDRTPTIRNKSHKRKSKLLKQNNKEEKEILSFVTQYQPSVSTIKEKGKSLKDMLVRPEKKKVDRGFHARIDVRPVNLCIFSHSRFVSILAIFQLAVFYKTSVVNCLVSS